jgi:hypothetical protein
MTRTLAELTTIIEQQNRLIERLQLENSEMADFIEALLEG